MKGCRVLTVAQGIGGSWISRCDRIARSVETTKRACIRHTNDARPQRVFRSRELSNLQAGFRAHVSQIYYLLLVLTRLNHRPILTQAAYTIFFPTTCQGLKVVGFLMLSNCRFRAHQSTKPS